MRMGRGERAAQAIAETEGVDGVLFGASDLFASMGYQGQSGHTEVQKVILDGIATVRAAGKAAGILATDPALLVKAATGLARRFGSGASQAMAALSGGY